MRKGLSPSTASPHNMTPTPLTLVAKEKCSVHFKKVKASSMVKQNETHKIKGGLRACFAGEKDFEKIELGLTRSVFFEKFNNEPHAVRFSPTFAIFLQ